MEEEKKEIQERWEKMAKILNNGFGIGSSEDPPRYTVFYLFPNFSYSGVPGVGLVRKTTFEKKVDTYGREGSHATGPSLGYALNEFIKDSPIELLTSLDGQTRETLEKYRMHPEFEEIYGIDPE